MNITDAREFLATIDLSNRDSVTMRMIEKMGDGLASYAPQLNQNMKKELKDFYCDILSNPFFDKDQSEYNPNIASEGLLQISNLDNAHIKEVIEDMESASNYVGDIKEANLERLNYYSFKFTKNDKNIYIFRRFTKMKKIRNGILGLIHDNSFKKLEEKNFFGLDRDIDILIFENEALIINKFALQTIFRLDDYFNNRATLALERLKQEDIFENFSDFHDGCINDKMAARRITKIINTPGRIDDFLKNFDQLPRVIEQFDLEIELSDDNKIKYNGTRESRNHILSCISDSYYQSLILQRLGEDPS
ncbi:Kiwa anti-phage protein KwaB-like domain-containing protein [Lactococcus garvieae]|uniref:Kiwa anti-phage protein KwaB-like domain-containing protein n=1 Tax=Lactococcus garvieae TaxID=1363 RepID=UPI00398EFC49